MSFRCGVAAVYEYYIPAGDQRRRKSNKPEKMACQIYLILARGPSFSSHAIETIIFFKIIMTAALNGMPIDGLGISNENEVILLRPSARQTVDEKGAVPDSFGWAYHLSWACCFLSRHLLLTCSILPDGLIWWWCVQKWERGPSIGLRFGSQRSKPITTVSSIVVGISRRPFVDRLSPVPSTTLRGFCACHHPPSPSSVRLISVCLWRTAITYALNNIVIDFALDTERFTKWSHSPLKV